MSAFEWSRHDERSKKEQRFRRPERARISWGKAMRGRGPGEGPNLSALGVADLRCALLKQVQPGMRVQTSAIAAAGQDHVDFLAAIASLAVRTDQKIYCPSNES